MVKAAIHPYHLHNHANQMTKVEREREERERGRGAVIYNTGYEELISDKVMTEGTDSTTYDRSQAMIGSIQNDPLAYQSPPAGML